MGLVYIEVCSGEIVLCAEEDLLLTKPLILDIDALRCAWEIIVEHMQLRWVIEIYLNDIAKLLPVTLFLPPYCL